MSRFTLDDELLDAQALRVAGSGVYGGADAAEVREACGRIKGTDLASWFESWTAAADAALAIGEREEASGHIESARNAYLRASNYHRKAGVMLLGTPIDPRLVASQSRQVAAFQSGAQRSAGSGAHCIASPLGDGGPHPLKPQDIVVGPQAEANILWVGWRGSV